ncbi:hypothetical protein ABZT51_26640 [Streptomyces sp. NPDC005373]|uniref:hypothetical protein n=1 Tax=Streptomyces sp. NPDC005373 TaxID=3156879 RepID=UPI0033B2BBD7
MPTALRWIALAMPLTHAVDATRHAANGATAGITLVTDFVTVTGLLLALLIGGASLRRKTS